MQRRLPHGLAQVVDDSLLGARRRAAAASATRDPAREAPPQRTLQLANLLVLLQSGEKTVKERRCVVRRVVKKFFLASFPCFYFETLLLPLGAPSRENVFEWLIPLQSTIMLSFVPFYSELLIPQWEKSEGEWEIDRTRSP